MNRRRAVLTLSQRGKNPRQARQFGSLVASATLEFGADSCE